MSDWKFDVYQVVNAVQYYDKELYVESIEKTWSNEEDAHLHLAELAVRYGAELEDGGNIFYQEPEGSNVEYSEWRIDVWGVHANG